MTSMNDTPETVNPVEDAVTRWDEAVALAQWQAATNAGTIREMQREIIELRADLARSEAKRVVLERTISDDRAAWEGIEPLLREVITSLVVDDEADGIERRLFIDGAWRDIYELLRGPFGHAPEERHSRRWANALAQILTSGEVPELRCHEGHTVGECPGPCTVCLTAHCDSPVDCERDAASEAARDRGRL